MTAQILLNLSERAYKRAESLAQMHHQGISEAIADYLEATLPATETENSDLQQKTKVFPRPEQTAALAREKQAYLQLHPQLKQKYFGQFVAIYGGKMIDVDPDFGRLVERVRSQFPNEVVWMSQVEDQSMPTIIVRSPTFVSDIE